METSKVSLLGFNKQSRLATDFSYLSSSKVGSNTHQDINSHYMNECAIHRKKNKKNHFKNRNVKIERMRITSTSTRFALFIILLCRFFFIALSENTEELVKLIDQWLKDNNYNQYGDPKGEQKDTGKKARSRFFISYYCSLLAVSFLWFFAIAFLNFCNCM